MAHSSHFYFPSACLLRAAPFAVEGTYKRTTTVSGKVVEELTNSFTVIVASNAYRIETTSMDFGAKATGPESPLRAAAQGNQNETITITSGVDASKGMPPLPSGPDIETLKRYKVNELLAVETGGFPSRANREVQALWIVYVAGEFFGSNWFWNVTKTNMGIAQKLHRKIVGSKTLGVTTNLVSGDEFVTEAAFYCDPEIHFKDGTKGTLVAPYDQGYRCLDYKVIDWMTAGGRVFPHTSEYRVCQPQDSRPTNGTNGYAYVKNADDVKPFIVYQFLTTAVSGGPEVLANLKAKEKVARVADWRLLDITATSYPITNSEWRSMADLERDPKMVNLIKHKADIIKEQEAAAQRKKNAAAAAVVPPSTRKARWVIIGFFGISFAGPLVWFVANRKRK